MSTVRSNSAVSIVRTVSEGGATPGVGNDDVYASEPRDGRLRRALERVEIAYVGLKCRGALAEPRGQLLERHQASADKAHVRATRVRLLRDLRPQAARGAGDEHDTTVELEPGSAAEEGSGNGHPPGGVTPRPRHEANGVADHPASRSKRKAITPAQP